MTLDQLSKPKNKMGRPRKEGSRERLRSVNWRLVIPNLQNYKNSSFQQLMQLKYSTLQLLKQRQKKYDLRYYHIALEHHVNGVPHLDILLIYAKSVQHKLTHFDYLIKHGKLTTYRKLNQAILDYGKKEDKEVLSNLPEDKVTSAGQTISQLIQVQDLKKDPYSYLYDRMKQDPLHFNLEQYVQKHQLSKHISGWSSLKTKLKDMQVAAANLTLKQKSGFKFIDRKLIQYNLNSDQLATFDSWKGYQTIVNKLNQIILYGCKRNFKTKQLLLVGPPNTGKTSLILKIQQFVSVYHLGVSNWYPNYRDGCYKLFCWDQFRLKGSMSHTDLLKFLQGSPMDLQYKGGSALRMDNQLIVMTSNMTLDQHIDLKFKDLQQRRLARQNLGVRIEQVCLPPGVDLFILRSLIVPEDL